jgi:long-chain acyl-CoA synthetase
MTSFASRTAIQLLQTRVEQSPRAAAYAVRIHPGRWKYFQWREVWVQVEQAARVLRELGVGPGDRLAILAKTCPEWFILEYAGMFVGAVIVGLDCLAPRANIKEMLSATQPKLLIMDEYGSELPRDVVTLATNAVSIDRFRLVDIRDLRQQHQSNCGSPITGASNTPSVEPQQSACLIFTSGTTGTPKAIEFKHCQLMAACHTICNAYPELEFGETTLCWLPMSHLFQRMMNLVAIARGATIHFVPEPREVIQYAGEVHPTVFVGVPRFFEKLRDGIERRIASLPAWQKRLVQLALAEATEHQKAIRAKCRMPLARQLKYFVLDRLVLARIRRVMGSRIKFMVTGSAPIQPRHIEFFSALGWPLLEAYGVSENTIPIAANLRSKSRIGSVGIPFRENMIRIAQDDEILIKGPGVFSGYWPQDDDDEQFTSDGFYKTGDLGTIDDDGFLYLLGRKSEMIKTSTGRKIFPTVLESVYQEHTLLERVIVFGEGRPYLVALIKIDVREACRRLGIEENAKTADELISNDRLGDMIREALIEQGQKLSSFQRIVKYTVVRVGFNIDTGELTPNLKIRRHAIKAKFAEQIERMYDESLSSPVLNFSASVSECAISS